MSDQTLDSSTPSLPDQPPPSDSSSSSSLSRNSSFSKLNAQAPEFVPKKSVTPPPQIADPRVIIVPPPPPPPVPVHLFPPPPTPQVNSPFPAVVPVPHLTHPHPHHHHQHQHRNHHRNHHHHHDNQQDKEQGQGNNSNNAGSKNSNGNGLSDESTQKLINQLQSKFWNCSTMIPADPSQRLSLQRQIKEGDLVIVYERHDHMKAIKVTQGSVLQNRFGVFKHSDWIGKPFGSKVFSNKNGFVYLLAPTPELWTLVLSHRTQILYIADISFLIMYLEIVPGCLVLESGTGSGSLTTSLARAVAPTGHVHTFDFHEQRAASAREDFEKTGVSSLVTVGVRDIQGEGFPDEFMGLADAVFLDLPQPWLAIPSAGKMLKPDGILCSFSPCIEQVQRASDALTSTFTDIRTFEILLRTYEVKEARTEFCEGDEGLSFRSPPRKKRQQSSEKGNAVLASGPTTVMAKPCGEARGHTGYLTFARLKCLS